MGPPAWGWMLGAQLTKLKVVSGELPLLIVGQLGGVDEGVVVAFVALNDLPAHLVLGLLQKEREPNGSWQAHLWSHPPGAVGGGSSKALAGSQGEPQHLLHVMLTASPCRTVLL